MELEKLNIPSTKVNQLKRVGVQQAEDLLYLYPRKYIDRTSFTGLLPEGESVILFHCETVQFHNNKVQLIEAKGATPGTTIPVHVLWFNQSFAYQTIAQSKGKPVLVAGTAKYMPAEPRYKKPERYEIIGPAVYETDIAAAQKIYPVYRKVPGMAEDYLEKTIKKAALLVGPPEETLPANTLAKHKMLSKAKMMTFLHNPPNAQALEMATTRRRWDDLLYFALRIELNNRNTPNGSIYGLPSLGDMNKIKNNLPFQLTNGQETALLEAVTHIRTGKRLNALIQGDVGCGKTIVAQLLMIAFASNGYQAAMMAPTQILARQHYEDLRKLCLPLNISVVYVGGGKGKERDKIQRAIAKGSAQLIVGTQALLSDDFQFHKLGLVIEDEEHKYGVLQRAALMEKVQGGTHTVTMSATPIPRSLAQTIYGDSLQLYTITEKPAGRKPVMTGIASNATKAISFLKRSCGQMGYQAYVVCPMIAPNQKVEGVTTAEEAFAFYEQALKDDGITVALVTGKTKKDEAASILKDFEAGAISVLVSTTIIEVGVNVPNANCIIIHNAERFGLAQLHQLRGRVGRGNSQAYCTLISADASNPRLQAMCKSNDGFMIAQMDLEQRGAGDFLGIQQSGTEKYLSLALQYPEEYRAAQLEARDILDNGESCLLLEQAIQDREEQKGGEILQER